MYICMCRTCERDWRENVRVKMCANKSAKRNRGIVVNETTSARYRAEKWMINILIERSPSRSLGDPVILYRELTNDSYFRCIRIFWTNLEKPYGQIVCHYFDRFWSIIARSALLRTRINYRAFWLNSFLALFSNARFPVKIANCFSLTSSDIF